MIRLPLLLITMLGSAVVIGTILSSTMSFGMLGAGFTQYHIPDKNHKTTLSPGLSLQEVIDAYLSPTVRDEKKIQNILMFSKSGGFVEVGNEQPNLMVNVPVIVEEQKGEISFQYFAEVKGDLTPALYHCSDIRLHVFLDKKYQYTTGWLGYDDRYPPRAPLETEIITIHDVEYGHHDVSLVPEGRVGGCNVEGYVFSWGGTVALFQELPAVPPVTLAGHWEFEDGAGSTVAIDSSGNNNTAALYGGAELLTSLDCPAGSGCASVDGIDDYINAGNSEALQIAGDITVTAWIKKAPIDFEAEVCVGKYYDTMDRGWVLVYDTDGTVHFDGRDGTGAYRAAVGPRLDDNKWHFVAGQRDGDTWKIYVDGKIADQNEVNSTGSINSASDNLYMGRYSASSGYCEAMIDDLRIYEGALEDSAIRATYLESRM